MGAGASEFPFDLHSTAVTDGAQLPVAFTCDGGDQPSPPLGWSNVRAGTKALALITLDPDATKNPPFGLVFNIPPNSTLLAQDASSKGLPTGSVQGNNDRDGLGWTGPCP
ncbi:MAG: hypothetical protein JWM80_6616, partial [Cyanobacteria bacterium RYN_339]|nr:hypothetical protein [Cyanobacteria bacterium RYN_339]